MTSREESDALDNLQRLLASDLSKAEDDELFAGIRAAELTFDQAQLWTGRLVRELRQREVPWSRIEAATGESKGTLGRRAERLQ